MRRWLGVVTLAVGLGCDTGTGGRAPLPATPAPDAAPDPVASPSSTPAPNATPTATPIPAEPATPLPGATPTPTPAKPASPLPTPATPTEPATANPTVLPATPGPFAWAGTRRIGVPFEQEDGNFVVRLPSGGVLVAGNGIGTFEPHLPSDVSYLHGFLAWLDETGAFLGARDVGVESGATIDGFAVSAEGNIAIAGWFVASGGAFVELRDPRGEPLWHLDLSSPDGAVAPYGAVFAPDGDLIVAGSSYPPPDPADPTARGPWVARYDATGKRRWLRVLGRDDTGYARAPVLAPDGGIVVVGRAGGSFVARLSPSGELAWLTRLPILHYAGPDDVGVDSRGEAYVAATTGDLDAYLARVDATGHVVWVRTIVTAGIDTGRGVVVFPAGGAVLVGKLGGDSDSFQSGGSRAFAARFTAEGDRTWLTEIPLSAGGYASGAALEPDGGVLVVGAVDELGGGSFSRDAFVARLDASGVVR
ncbi:hypothetical protein [Anaeromyxobacter terrae]|uniref:hypothetical protein n=1 Tax=Anaeromyxobacter terrae TaxID=2925406 RepID=UPI001F55D99C|nr:hypothetical protein [Anaeromyxobacter sp. SG22]